MGSPLSTEVRGHRTAPQRSLASSEAYVSQLLKGKRKNPNLDVLKRLARALGVPVTELLE
jgi:transcriptional regulator with XRE-family HTH domain